MSDLKGLGIEAWERLPACLRSLWKDRGDLQIRFPGHTVPEMHDYLGWCITEGIEQGSVTPPVLDGALCEYLDRSDGAAQPHPCLPSTLLLRIMRPLYTGHCQEEVRLDLNPEFTSELLAAWVCTTARRFYGWPESFVGSLREWLCRPSDHFRPNVPGLTMAMAAVYRSRPDVQAAYKLEFESTHFGFASWMINNGVFEYDWDRTLLSEDFLAYLRRRESKSHSDALTNFHFLTWKGRPDRWEAFPLASAENEAAFARWVLAHRQQDRVFKFWLPLLFESDC